MEAYVYNFDGRYKKITELLISLKYKCSIDKPAQEVTFQIPYGVYSDAFPSFNFATGQKFEMYEGDRCIFRGKIETVSYSFDKETMTCIVYDYIRTLTKCKITRNFENISAHDAICDIFNELEIPYTTKGILGGDNDDDEGKKININHIIKNKSAYDACMMIATEVHRQTGTYFYMYMDVSGNVGLMPCDRYWSKQTIKPCSSPSLKNPDGNIISFSYKEDASNIINRVLLYTSDGRKVDLNTGEEEAEKDESGTSSNTSANGKVIGIDMGHNSHVSGASALLDEVTENRKVGNEVISLLKEEGYKVIDCTDNSGTTESEELANRISKMNAQKLDLSISIHFDAGGGSGTSVYYNSKAGNSLAYGFLSKVSQSCGFNSRTISLHDGSDGGESFYVLKHNNNPAILLEVCFVDSSKDKSLYDSSKVANAIVEAVKEKVK